MTTIAEAKGILGETNVFGPDEWLRYYSGKVSFTKAQLAPVSRIPWSKEELRNPAIEQEHFLFLGLDKLNEKPLDLVFWHDFSPHGPRYPFNGEENAYLTHAFARAVCKFHWYLMPKDTVPNSADHSYDDQLAMLPNDYEVPTATERVTAYLLHIQLDKRGWGQAKWARTRDRGDGGRHVVVREDQVYATQLDNEAGSAFMDIALCASRSIPGRT